MNKSLILSIDLGTSNLKGAVFDIDGKEIAFESIEYNLYTPQKDIVENDTNLYWENVLKILKKLSDKLGNRANNILAIGTSSQGETIVPVDKYGEPLRNAIVWIDTRSKAEAKDIRKNFNICQMYEKTGCPDVDPSWPATRILWIKNNEKDIFEKTHKFLLLEDFIVFKLTGQFFGEASVYSSTYYYDIVKFDFIDEILNFIGISRKKLPEVLRPGSFVSNLKPDIADYLNFDRNTKVVIGAMDQICGAVGAGNVFDGVITETTGSAFAMVVTIDKPIFDKNYNLPCIPHAVENLYALMPYSSTGGMVLKWFKDKFCKEEIQKAEYKKISVFKILDEIAEKILPGSEGLIMLPFITGAFFPEFNANARGIFFGICINHEKAHFIRAILESLGYMMRKDLEIINNLGIKINDVTSIGGGASSKLWGQIKADICGKTIKIPEYTECALLGSAIIAACAVELFKNIRDASKNFIKIKDIFYPKKSNKKIYDINYKKYTEIYEKLKNSF